MPLLRLSFALALALPSAAAAQTGAPGPIAVEVPIEIARDLRLRPESVFDVARLERVREPYAEGKTLLVERLRVPALAPGDALARLGFAAGDVIEKANGADVGARDIVQVIAILPPEPMDVPIVVRRDDRAVTLLLRIPAIPEGNRWTLAYSTATAPFILEASELETLRGAAGEAAIAALIEDASTNVVSIGAKEASDFAMRHALAPGDELVAIDGSPIAKRADVRAALGRVAALKGEVVRVELRRGGTPRRHDYRLHWTAPADVVRLVRPGNYTIPRGEVALARRRFDAGFRMAAFVRHSAAYSPTALFEAREVVPGSLFDRLGVEPGDDIKSLNGKSPEGEEDLERYIVARLEDGSILRIEYFRAGRLVSMVWRIPSDR